MRKARAILLMMSAVVAAAACGCVPAYVVPIPVPPWTAARMEEKYCHDKDFKTPILPPIRQGYPPPLCEDQPSVQRVLRAMPPITRGVPFVYEEFRDDIQIVNERMVDTIDPARFFPLVGPAQLHHCHWKCTIYYTETIESSYPFPFKCKRPRVEVVMIDLDHLHLYPCGTAEVQQSIGRDLIQN